MRILVLHAGGPLDQMRLTSFHHLMSWVKYAPQHDYVYHAYPNPHPESARGDYDIIILDTTFLCFRWATPKAVYFDRIFADYGWIEQSKALKIALPQDEYDFATPLDEWLHRWRVDIVYSIFPDHADVLYPKTRGAARILKAHTGYVDDASIEPARLLPPLASRSIDLGYRARDLPAKFGWFGRRKAAIAEEARAALAGKGLVLDISTREADAKVGDDWTQFQKDCRHMLAGLSGASLIDPSGEIAAACAQLLRENPNLTFEEIGAQAFPGLDRAEPMAAISPRILESAQCGTGLVLIDADYGLGLEPWCHYAPFADGGANGDEVAAALRDISASAARAAALREHVLSLQDLRYSHFVAQALTLAGAPMAPPTTSGDINAAARAFYLKHWAAPPAYRAPPLWRRAVRKLERFARGLRQ